NDCRNRAIYKGATLGVASGHNFLFVTNFHAGRVEIYNENFQPVNPGGFVDPNLPAGYAPFGIHNLNGQVYVAYALQDSKQHDEVAGPGNGFVDAFDTSGNFLRRVVSNGNLNAPWGLALVEGKLWVGNFGDGKINNYNPTTGAFLETLSTAAGTPLQFDGLWDLLPPANGVPSTANIVDLLIKDGIVSDADVSRSLAAQAHMDWIDLSAKVIPPDVINQIRAEDARRFKVIPVGYGESGLIVAVSDPLDIDAIDSLSFLLQREIELVCASPEKIRQALIKYYGTADEASDILAQQIGQDVDFGLEITEGGSLDSADEADAPIIRMVSMLLIEAHRLGASDVHLEPLDKKFRVRFRIDGVLQEMQAPPKRLQSAIVSRLKIMTGSMSIAEKRLPQDGRIQVKIA